MFAIWPCVAGFLIPVALLGALLAWEGSCDEKADGWLVSTAFANSGLTRLIKGEKHRYRSSKNTRLQRMKSDGTNGVWESLRGGVAPPNQPNLALAPDQSRYITLAPD